METKVFLIADYASIDQSGKLNLLGVFDAINAPSFPSIHSLLFVIVRLGAELGEFGISRNFRITLYDDDMNEKASAQGDFTVPVPQGGKRAEINLIVGVRDLLFEKPGHYEWRLLVNDDLKGTTPLDVNLVDPG